MFLSSLKKKNASMRGFSLVETAIVLGVVGVVTGGVVVAMSSARKAAISGQLQQQILVTVNNIRSYFAGRAMPTLAADITANYTQSVMRAAGVFSEDMCPANCVSGSITTVYNVYGGTVTFALPDDDANTLPDGNSVKLTLTGINRQGCIELGMKFGGRVNEIGLSGFKIGSNSTITTFAVPLSTLNTQCAASNTVVTYFKIRN